MKSMVMRGIFKEWEKVRGGPPHLGEERTFSWWLWVIFRRIWSICALELSQHPLWKICCTFLPWCSGLKLFHRFHLNPDHIWAICRLASAFSKLMHLDGSGRFWYFVGHQSSIQQENGKCPPALLFPLFVSARYDVRSLFILVSSFQNKPKRSNFLKKIYK